VALERDGGGSVETVDVEPSSRRVPRWVWLAAAGVTVGALVGVWFLTAPDEVASPGATVGLQVAPGDSAYVGYYPLSERDLVIEAIEPVTLNGPDVALWLCDPAPDTDPLGSSLGDDLAEHCRSLDPFLPGAVIAGRHPDWRPTEPYLMVELTPTSDQPQGLCALDITYRPVDGWRTGRQRNGGQYRAVVNEDPEVDWPDEELLTACESW
jgi:hypothetical protein